MIYLVISYFSVGLNVFLFLVLLTVVGYSRKLHKENYLLKKMALGQVARAIFGTPVNGPARENPTCPECGEVHG